MVNALVSAFPPATLVDTAAVRVSTAPAIARLSLRARGELAPLSGALGTPLPARIGEIAGETTRIACLGPDEWLILAPAAAPVVAACAAVYAELPHSLTDISGREVSFHITGPRAAELLTTGCPRDIDAFPLGEVRRTVFHGIAVTLWRNAPDSFQLDTWNSFAPHIRDTLKTAAREFNAETD